MIQLRTVPRAGADARGHVEPRPIGGYGLIVPALATFDPRTPRRLYEAFGAVRRAFAEAGSVLDMTDEALLLELSDARSHEEVLASGRTARWRSWVQRRNALFPLVKGLHAVFQEEHGYPAPPRLILGNSWGLFGGMLLAGALDLRGVIELFNVWAGCVAESWDDDLRILEVETRSLDEVQRRLALLRGAVHVFHVRQGRRSLRALRLSLVGGRGALEAAREVLSDALARDEHPLTEPVALVPFHTPVQRDCVERLRRCPAALRIGAPRIPVVSCRPEIGLMTRGDELLGEVLHTLHRPVRWDLMEEQIQEADLPRLVVLLKREQRDPETPHRLDPDLRVDLVGDAPAARVTKEWVLGDQDRLRRLSSRASLLDGLEALIEAGRRVLLVDGYSGAGKSHLMAALAARLDARRVPTVRLHGGDFTRPGALKGIERVLMESRGAAPFEIACDRLTDQDALAALLRAARDIRSGLSAPSSVTLEGLSYERSTEETFERRVSLRQESVILIEGNVLMSEAVAPWIDVAFLVTVDRGAGVDLARVLARGRSRGRGAPEDVDWYRRSVLYYRRQLVERHVTENIHRFDYVVDNTDLDRPLVIARDPAGLEVMSRGRKEQTS
jgi:uridine kinase/malonyl CoA-acyl carrier protein transacylase